MSYHSAVAALPASSRSLGVRRNTDFVRSGALTLSHSRKSEARMRTWCDCAPISSLQPQPCSIAVNSLCSHEWHFIFGKIKSDPMLSLFILSVPIFFSGVGQWNQSRSYETGTGLRPSLQKAACLWGPLTEKAECCISWMSKKTIVLQSTKYELLPL